MIIRTNKYVAEPLKLTFSNPAEMADAAWKARMIVKRCSEHEAFFSDYMRDTPAAKQAVMDTLTKSDAQIWEVWSLDQNGHHLDLCGILRLSELSPSCNAKAHYFFFDGRLRDKTDLLLAWKKWAFAKEGLDLHRVTIEVPAYAKALSSHAQRHLGFQMEGIMKDAIKWHGDWHDVYVMGCLANG